MDDDHDIFSKNLSEFNDIFTSYNLISPNYRFTTRDAYEKSKKYIINNLCDKDISPHELDRYLKTNPNNIVFYCLTFNLVGDGTDKNDEFNAFSIVSGETIEVKVSVGHSKHDGGFYFFDVNDQQDATGSLLEDMYKTILEVYQDNYTNDNSILFFDPITSYNIYNNRKSCTNITGKYAKNKTLHVTTNVYGLLNNNVEYTAMLTVCLYYSMIAINKLKWEQPIKFPFNIFEGDFQLTSNNYKGFMFDIQYLKNKATPLILDWIATIEDYILQLE